MESFYTIQGEGTYQGYAAYFVRLGGCDVGCVWCDVKESWNAKDHPLQSVDHIISDVRESKSEIVVITGGEPAMYDLTMLTRSLQADGLRTHIETSGAYPLTGHWDWVCLSPKKFKKPHSSVYEMADELKVIVYNASDLKWAAAESIKVGENCNLFLQPEWSVEKKVLPMIIDFIKENPAWRISLQVHKYMNIP
ncbi:MAG: radical SAM protein [Flammeovirgaceae bacterium]|nr:radical SAM protein [Flammeovirgaceae bacterium]